MSFTGRTDHDLCLAGFLFTDRPAKQRYCSFPFPNLRFQKNEYLCAG